MVRIRFSPNGRGQAGEALGKRRALMLSFLMVLIPISTLQAQTSLKPFLGRWDLTLKTPAKELPSWIELSEEQGQPKVLMVGISDHAAPLPHVQVKEGEIEFLSPKGAEGFAEDMTFKGKLVGGQLVGVTTGSSGTSWQWTGRRAPALKRTGAPKWGTPIALFNGKDFTGWRFSDPIRAGNWTIEGGTLVSHGGGAEAITLPQFEDFKLHLEFNYGPQANSGVYLRGRYEVQIETDITENMPSRYTGAVYGFLAPRPELPPRLGEWQSFDITLVGRTVTVVQNGQTVIDHQEIPGITGGALDSHEELPGPIYLQGSEEGRVAFRNIVITPAQK